MRMLSTCPCPLASNCLTWATLSQPRSCFGLSTRDDVSSLWLRGATAPCFFHHLTVPCCLGVPYTLVSSNPPPSLCARLLLCGSLSYSLPPNLSCSLLLSLSCCSSLFLSHCALPSLSLFLSLSPSRPKKGGSGRSVHLYPPRGSNHPLRDRRGVVYPLGHDNWVSAPCAPIFLSCVSPPVMRIFFRMGVCSAVCRGTAQRPRVPGPPA